MCWVPISYDICIVGRFCQVNILPILHKIIVLVNVKCLSNDIKAYAAKQVGIV